MATLLALFEEAGNANLVKAAAKGLVGKVGIWKAAAPAAGPTGALTVARETILASLASDEELRHRLWLELVTALNIGGAVPLLPRLARQLASASASAVRVSERLSPALRKAQELAKAKRVKQARVDAMQDHEPDWIADFGHEVGQKIDKAKALFATQHPLPFPVIVITSGVSQNAACVPFP